MSADVKSAPHDEEAKDKGMVEAEDLGSSRSFAEIKASKLEQFLGKRVSRVYANPYSQVALVGMVAFLCPGMFNCLSGIGGGGQVSSHASDKASIALYSTFASVSFVAGSINNKLGTRWTLWLGSLGYVVYVSSFLSYNFNANQGFVIFAGALLGVCASLFWSAQGALMLCYPSEANKARAISLFWVIFNLGAVIGSAIAMGLSWHSSTGAALSNGTYAAFVVLTFLGGCIAALLKDPATMIRTDGSRVVVPTNTTWAQELKGLYVILRSDPYIILLFPMFFAANFFYTWQFNDFNGALFTLRTRSLNSLLYWLSQIFGALCLSFIADSKLMSRRTRAWVNWAIVTVIVFVVWGGSYAQQREYTRDNIPAEFPMDLTAGSPYAARAFLYIFSGFMDAVWQVNVYWLMGAISNDLGKLAMLAGFYKCLQSAGAAVAFGLDLNLQPYMTILGVSWGLCAVGLLFAAPVIALRVHEHTSPLEEKTVLGREWEIKRAMEEGSKRNAREDLS